MRPDDGAQIGGADYWPGLPAVSFHSNSIKNNNRITTTILMLLCAKLDQ